MGVLAKKRKGKPALSGHQPLDEALWALAEVLGEIAQNGPSTEANQWEGTINTEESAADDETRE